MSEHRRPAGGPPPPVRDFVQADLKALRRDVTRFARDNGLTDPALYRFVLAVHELATNAVSHGGGTGCLEIARTGDELRCRISDRGPGMPYADPPGRPPADALRGRGLWLAQHGGHLSWDSDYRGTAVTLTYNLAAAP